MIMVNDSTKILRFEAACVPVCMCVWGGEGGGVET